MRKPFFSWKRKNIKIRASQRETIVAQIKSIDFTCAKRIGVISYSVWNQQVFIFPKQEKLAQR
ncbi:MAG: hypothetical protein A2007_00230 [Verrucomicrobia bacterium GWC2_42_7]|nr:MAG: hypothetical protein A2007_00230 [Verrucomicrobia bacterium GWC2_42_7]